MSNSSESGELDDDFSNVTEEEDEEKSTDLIEEESRPRPRLGGGVAGARLEHSPLSYYVSAL